jgi:hypothetical protein
MVDSRWKNQDPPDGEFNTWQTPEDILGHLAGRIEGETIKRKFVERLRTGVVVAYARSSVQGRQGIALHTPKSIERAAWCDADPSDLDRFWEDGDLIVRRGALNPQSYTERYLDIRFEPESLAGRAPRSSVAAAVDPIEKIEGETEKAKADKPTLPDAALKLWHQAFLKAYPHGSKALAEQSAIGAFPNHHVARSRVRELFPDAQRGRPKKNNGLENSPENDGE